MFTSLSLASNVESGTVQNETVGALLKNYLELQDSSS